MVDIITRVKPMLGSTSVFEPQPAFPTLQIIPVEKLIPHERNNSARTHALQGRLISDGILRNPPIVSPLQNSQGEFVVLDGANRTNAFKAMQVPDILAQVALPGDPGLKLKTWNQVVLGISSEDLIFQLSGLSDIQLVKSQNIWQLQDSDELSIVIQIHLPSGDVYSAFSEDSDLLMRIQLLNTIMDRIGTFARLDRTNLQVVSTLKDLHPDLAGVIVFPYFKIEEILHLAASRMMVPAGITRFTMSPRALRVNYEIRELNSEKPLTEKNKMLMTWIKERVASKGVRSYDETTVMFDE